MKTDWVCALTIASIFSLPSTHALPPSHANDIKNEAEFENIIESLPLDYLDVANSNFKCTPTDAKFLKLLGRGVQSKRSGNAIAVACETDACLNLRFVYFKKTNPHPCFIGAAIAAPQSNNSKALKKAYKLVIQEYLDYHPTTETAIRRSNLYGLFFAVMVAGTVAIGLNGPVSGPGAGQTALKGMSFMLATYFIFTHRNFVNMVIGDHTIDVTMSDHSGWNWSERARPIGKNKFRLLLNQIVYGKAVVDGKIVDKNPFELDFRYEKLKRKLEKKGVTFPEQTRYW